MTFGWLSLHLVSGGKIPKTNSLSFPSTVISPSSLTVTMALNGQKDKILIYCS